VFRHHEEYVPKGAGLPRRLRGQDAMKDATALVAARVSNLIARRVPAVGRLSNRAPGAEVPVDRRPEGQHAGRSTGVLLDVVGRSGGERRPVMFMYVRRGEDLVVIGSGGGSAATPNWYRN
jgi:F420H(2)-dependent quinone reductase